jgi:hypothetical protein
VAYSERLAAEDIRGSVGAVGSSYDCEHPHIAAVAV